MQRNQKFAALAAALSMAVVCGAVHGQEPVNTVRIGYTALRFNTKSGDLTGQRAAAAFTPPGMMIDLKDTGLLSLGYERRLSDEWSVMLQAGVGPVIKAEGAGTASAAGTIGSARAWTPALLAAYSFPRVAGVRPYMGAGVNYAFFTGEEVRPVYSTAFGGPSSMKLKPSWGTTVLLGAEYPIAKNWVVDFSYLHYWTKTTVTFTTETPGVGALVRTGNVKANPDHFAFSIGYKF